MSHLLNIRVYEEKDNQVIIGLSHFETNSRMVFACEFDASHDVDPWGVTPIEILVEPTPTLANSLFLIK